MTYYNSKTVKGSTFAGVKSRLAELLKEEGFGVLSEIDLKDTLKKKIDKDHLPHTILGACHPVYADRALSLDPHISTMLPCNVTVRELPNGDIEAASINPAASMGAIGNPALVEFATEVQEKLLKVIGKL